MLTITVSGGSVYTSGLKAFVKDGEVVIAKAKPAGNDYDNGTNAVVNESGTEIAVTFATPPTTAFSVKLAKDAQVTPVLGIAVQTSKSAAKDYTVKAYGADGAETSPSTKITFTFTEPVDLSTGTTINFDDTAGKTGATKGDLTKDTVVTNGTVWNLAIGTPIKAGDVTISIDNTAITSLEKTVRLFAEILTIGIDTTGFDALPVVVLPDDLADIKTSDYNHENIIFDGVFYCVQDNKIDAFRGVGGKQVQWDHSGAEDDTIWKYDALTNVRVDATLFRGDANEAYLLAFDGTNTFEVIKSRFLGLYTGQPMTDLNKVESLTFGATAPGTYNVKITINEVDPATGVAVTKLAEQTLTFVVTAAD
jgi:hypothetical protein